MTKRPSRKVMNFRHLLTCDTIDYSVTYFCLITFSRDTDHIPINDGKSWHAFFNLASIHPIQPRLTHYFYAYTIGLVSYWKVEPEGQVQGKKRGRFLNHFTGKNQILFHESKLLYHGIQYPKKYLRWEVHQIMKITHFSVKPIITLTCRHSLIDPVTNKFILEF